MKARWRGHRCPALGLECLEAPEESVHHGTAPGDTIDARAYRFHGDTQHTASPPNVWHVSCSDGRMLSGMNSLYHQLIAELGNRTGRLVVMNISFNVWSEPISRTPLEAARPS